MLHDLVMCVLVLLLPIFTIKLLTHSLVVLFVTSKAPQFLLLQIWESNYKKYIRVLRKN